MLFPVVGVRIMSAEAPVVRLSCRPAAGGRAREEPPGAEQGAGAGPAAHVLQQPGAAAGDRGKSLVRHLADAHGASAEVHVAFQV